VLNRDIRTVYLLSLAGVTVLLALTVYQIIVNEKLPTSSEKVPAIGNICLTFKSTYCMEL